MQRSFSLLWCIVICTGLFFISCNKRSGQPRILLFSKTAGYHHNSIPDGITAIEKLGKENKFDVDTTTNAAFFNQDSLSKYAAVVFLNTTDTTDTLLDQYQEAEFERYIQAGGSFVGIHAATDAEYHWGWYGRLVGGYFNSHPPIQEAILNVMDSTHSSTKDLPKQWKRKDEWYNFKNLSKDVNVLLAIDEASYKGGTNGASHPMAWYKVFDGGRVFYTELVNPIEHYAEQAFLQHLLGGIQYAIGNNTKLDYAKAHTEKVPERDRFVKTILNQGNFFEPTEMAILPNLNILIAQRRGELMLYNNANKEVKQVGFLNVYHQTSVPGVNAEEGVLGLTLDPDYKTNNYVYVFYSPVDTSVNRLSRFEFKGDTIDTRTEKIILQVYSQREICCHTGGSIAFGNDRLLYLSTGDNSTPFDEPKQPHANHGFAPLDDRPGHEQYDARRSSGNTADLRGKTIRIRIKPDGSYEIPEGNLFPGNDPKTRPEIYTMGHRNPYRISVDKKTNFLYWGEVGPDSNVDSFDTRGPRGYDEVNQARKAGFFGWPLFIANNYAYHDHDYATGNNGAAFDPAKPINASRNNTGLQELPPAEPAFIYYPYGFSKDFPQVGTGGRNAMAGPVYYTEDFPKDTRYPDYFNGKFFIYEWMRGWIKLVQMKPNGDFDKMDGFMEGTKFNSPIDMEVGPDGKIYVLEYGSGWFSKNPDAAISRIDYIPGNRPPKVDSLKIAKESGGLPFTMNASIQAKDPEGDALTYRWKVGEVVKETKEPTFQYTINKGGEYLVSVEVLDENKSVAKSAEVTVFAGNEQPVVDVVLQGNSSFYFPGRPVRYTVKVNDEGQKIDTANLYIATDFIESNEDLAGQGHQVVPQTILGKNIMLSLDCKSCHKLDEKSIGPAYSLVARRYQTKTDASSFLINKIIKGGAGNWGEVAMPAHPTLKEGDAKLITTWILSLGSNKKIRSLPITGSVVPKTDLAQKGKAFVLTASYTDVGGMNVRPLTGSQSVFLRSNTFDAAQLNLRNGLATKDSAGNKYLQMPATEGWVTLNKVDLTAIKSIELSGFGNGLPVNYKIEIRKGAKEGTKIGEAEMLFAGNKQSATIAVPIQVSKNEGTQDLFIVVRKAKAEDTGRPLLKTVRFVPQ